MVTLVREDKWTGYTGAEKNWAGFQGQACWSYWDRGKNRLPCKQRVSFSIIHFYSIKDLFPNCTLEC